MQYDTQPTHRRRLFVKLTRNYIIIIKFAERFLLCADIPPNLLIFRVECSMLMLNVLMIVQVLELYDKGCQANLGGAGAGGAGGVEQGDDADGTQSQSQSASTSTSTSLLKKTPEKRRNHLRCHTAVGKFKCKVVQDISTFATLRCAGIVTS